MWYITSDLSWIQTKIFTSNQTKFSLQNKSWASYISVHIERKFRFISSENFASYWGKISHHIERKFRFISHENIRIISHEKFASYRTKNSLHIAQLFLDHMNNLLHKNTLSIEIYYDIVRGGLIRPISSVISNPTKYSPDFVITLSHGSS